jgi:hypothetical protein
MRRALALIAPTVAVLCLIGGTASADGATGAYLAKGHFGQRHWFVAVEPQGEHRKGIAFEVGSFDRVPGNGVDYGAEYSAPAVKRGVVSVEARPGRGPDFPEMTVVGMAMNKAVKAVEVTYFDGSNRRLVPGAIRPSLVDGSPVANFDYIAFAMRGPWCARRLVTLDRRGDPLWETELSASEVDDESVSRATCPGFTTASPETGN